MRISLSLWTVNYVMPQSENMEFIYNDTARPKHHNAYWKIGQKTLKQKASHVFTNRFPLVKTVRGREIEESPFLDIRFGGGRSKQTDTHMAARLASVILKRLLCLIFQQIIEIFYSPFFKIKLLLELSAVFFISLKEFWFLTQYLDESKQFISAIDKIYAICLRYTT